MIDITVLRCPQWRQYRGISVIGIAYDFKGKINNENLTDFVVEYSISDLYVSSACYLNPRTVSSKKRMRAGYPSIFLGMDFVMDFDNEVDYLKSQNFLMSCNPYLIIKTSRGYHAWFTLKNVLCEGFNEREDACYSIVKNLVEYMHKNRVRFDEKCSLNTRNVFRVPGSLHRSGEIMEIVYTNPSAVFGFPEVSTSHTLHQQKTQAIKASEPNLGNDASGKCGQAENQSLAGKGLNLHGLAASP